MQARYDKLFSELLKYIAIGVTIVFVVTLVISGLESVEHQHTQKANTRTAKLTSFYKTVAGVESMPAGSPGGRLARDLKKRLGSVDPEASSLPNAIEDFRGTSTMYGGVSSNIGVNPFSIADSSCSECGPLSEYIKAGLLDIKRGNLDSLTKSLAPKSVGNNVLTPFGIPTLAWIFILYLLLGDTVIWFAQYDVHTYNYSVHPLELFSIDWNVRTEPSGYKLGIILLAPIVFVIGLPIAWYFERRAEHNVAEKFPEVAERIAEIDDVIDKLHGVNDNRVKDLISSRDSLKKNVREACNNDSLSIEYMLNRANLSLEDVKQSLAYKQQAKEELETEYGNIS